MYDTEQTDTGQTHRTDSWANMLTLEMQVPKKKKLMGQVLLFPDLITVTGQYLGNPTSRNLSLGSGTTVGVTFHDTKQATLSPSAKIISRLTKFLYF